MVVNTFYDAKACDSYHHHFIRYKMVCGKKHVTPVGLRAPLPSDFCCYCKKSRAETEAGC
jgi:hypothetical protein